MIISAACELVSTAILIFFYSDVDIDTETLKKGKKIRLFFFLSLQDHDSAFINTVMNDILVVDAFDCR